MHHSLNQIFDLFVKSVRSLSVPGFGSVPYFRDLGSLIYMSHLFCLFRVCCHCWRNPKILVTYVRLLELSYGKAAFQHHMCSFVQGPYMSNWNLPFLSYTVNCLLMKASVTICSGWYFVHCFRVVKDACNIVQL